MPRRLEFGTQEIRNRRCGLAGGQGMFKRAADGGSQPRLFFPPAEHS
jgi:hypothetical protein